MESQNAFGQWRAGGHLDGVHFGPNVSALILDGEHAGMADALTALQSLAPEPLYVVDLGASGQDVVVSQSMLQRFS